MSELKTKLCAFFDLKEKETQLWDYYKGDYYEKLDTPDKLSLTLDVAKLLPNQQVMLEEKVRRSIASSRSHPSPHTQRAVKAQAQTRSQPSLSNRHGFEVQKGFVSTLAGLYTRGDACVS